MPEASKRTTAEIQQEYNNLAFKSGNLQYEIVERKSNLAMINDTMRSLSLEYVSVKAAEDKAKAEAAETKPAEGTTS